jgi:transcriptional regulator with XRE-family HTH domain
MDTENFTEALTRAMDQARVNQSELGRAAGAAPAMLSAWLSGRTANPEPQKVFAVERALGLRPGALSCHLGYVPADPNPPEIDVRSAIAADPSLSDKSKSALGLLYEVLSNEDVASGRSPADTAQATG